MTAPEFANRTSCPTISVLKSAEAEKVSHELFGSDVCVQFAPAFVEMKTPLLKPENPNFVPSAEQAAPTNSPGIEAEDHVTPKLVE